MCLALAYAASRMLMLGLQRSSTDRAPLVSNPVSGIVIARLGQGEGLTRRSAYSYSPRELVRVTDGTSVEDRVEVVTSPALLRHCCSKNRTALP